MAIIPQKSIVIKLLDITNNLHIGYLGNFEPNGIRKPVADINYALRFKNRSVASHFFKDGQETKITNLPNGIKDFVEKMVFEDCDFPPSNHWFNAVDLKKHKPNPNLK